MAQGSDPPLIGVTISRHKSRIARFFDWLAIRRQGGRVIFLAPGTAVDPASLDGLVIGGGDDIGANIYGGELNLDVRIDPERDELELSLLRHAAARNMPVLGICRGAQIMNVFFGGTLIASIRGMPPREKTNMRTVLARKAVTLVPGTRIHGIIGRDAIKVNSLHHQAVDRVGDGLRISGRDRGDFVQALELIDMPFFLGVQWHPEFLFFKREHQNLFHALTQAAARYRDQAC